MRISIRELVKHHSNGDIIEDGLKLNQINSAITRLSYIKEGNYVKYLLYLLQNKYNDMDYIMNLCSLINNGNSFKKSLLLLDKVKTIINE